MEIKERENKIPDKIEIMVSYWINEEENDIQFDYEGMINELNQRINEIEKQSKLED